VGAAVCGRFGDTLPFLVKVLAAAEPLSLQAHPSAQQAVEGFGREERQGIPVSSPVRNYRDRSHKPELLVARGSVQGTGRVPVRGAQCRAVARAEGFGPRPFVGLLHDQSEADGLRALFTTWITAPQQDLDVLVPAVIDGAIQYVHSGQEEIRRRSRDGARVGRALSRRRRRAGLAAAEPDQPEGSRKWWKIAPRDSPMVCSSRRTVALS
jgi:mannose-6-phosphate isomerase